MDLTPNQTLWLEDLLSGKYAQGKMFLRDKHDKFCCLGVACDLFYPEPAVKEDHDSVYLYGGKHGSYPPAKVVKALGLRDKYGSAKSTYKPSLADLNDSGCSFSYIVAVIKQNPEEYFL